MIRSRRLGPEICVLAIAGIVVAVSALPASAGGISDTWQPTDNWLLEVKLADTRLAPKMSQLPGVGLVSISGGQKPAVRIQANPTAMASYGLNLEELRTAILAAEIAGLPALYREALTQDKWRFTKPVRIGSVSLVDDFETTPWGTSRRREPLSHGLAAIDTLEPTKGAVGRIVGPNAGAGPVSLGRMDTDVVVTEFGAADLRGLGHHGRAQALIAVAPPGHRETLEKAWAALAAKF